jgi:hypothetical protein
MLCMTAGWGISYHPDMQGMEGVGNMLIDLEDRVRPPTDLE